METSSPRPASADELRLALVAISRDFGEDCTREDLNADGTWQFVMHCFHGYYGQEFREFSERQLRSLGALLNDAVSQDDALEKAVSNAFLEQLRDKSYEALQPFLSKAALTKTRI